MLSPVLDEISNSEDLNTSIIRVDIDDSPLISSSMKIRTVPSIFYFKDGNPVEKFVESASKKNIIQFIKNNE